MKKTQKSIARYLLTLHFDNLFTPNSLAGKIEQVESFLEDVGKLARQNGIAFQAEYGIVSGKTGTHSHIMVNWLPTKTYEATKRYKRHTVILRKKILGFMNDNFFRIDAPEQRIKRITHHVKRVRRYIQGQSKNGQTLIYSGKYRYVNFVPVYTEKKIGSYYTSQFSGLPENVANIGCVEKLKAISFLAFILSLMISLIVAQLL